MHGHDHLRPDHRGELAPDPGKPGDETRQAHDDPLADPSLGEVVEAQPLVRLVVRAEDHLELGPDVVAEDLHAGNAEERAGPDVSRLCEPDQPLGKLVQRGVQHARTRSRPPPRPK